MKHSVKPGTKAKAAIFAGIVAFSLAPAAAYAAPQMQPGQQPGQPSLERADQMGGDQMGGGQNGGACDQEFGGMQGRPEDAMMGQAPEEFAGQEGGPATIGDPSQGQGLFGEQLPSVPSDEQQPQGQQPFANGDQRPEEGQAPEMSEMPSEGEQIPEKPAGEFMNQRDGQQQPGQQNNQQPNQQPSLQSGSPTDRMRDLFGRFIKMLGLNVSDSRIDEFLKSVQLVGGQQPGGNMQQPGGQQPGGNMQQAGGQQPGGNMQQPGAQQPGGQQPGGNGQQPGQANAQQPGGQQPGQASGQQPSAQQPGGNAQQPGQANGQPGGQSSAPTSYDAANTLASDASNVSYNSTTGSQNAVLVDGKNLSLNNVSVNKTGDATGEDADFYGINAAILANNGSTLTIANSNVTTDGTHANGVFSYGQGTTVNISDSTITTTGNNSGGLMTTGGAALNATNLTVTTSGNSSAAIRTDRGGGTVTATKGSYSTSGVGSPAIYSTADITVSDATLSASNSEAVVIEGGNSVTINNSNVTGSNARLNGQSTIKTNVLIYQSMSGDASEGDSDFSMTGGSLTSLTGSMFHVTNTTTTINLSGVSLTNAADSSDFLIASADSWGTSGKNGGNATVNLSNQTVEGNITVDSASSVTLNIKDGSSYTGAISNKGTTNVAIEAGSTWTLTGDSYVTSLSNAGTINLNGHKLYVNGVEYTA